MSDTESPNGTPSTGTRKVIEYLDLAIEAAEEAEMSTIEIVGILHYYAHNLAQEARESTLESQGSDE